MHASETTKHAYIVGKTLGNYKFPTDTMRNLFKLGFRMVRLPDKRVSGDRITVADPFPAKALLCSKEGWVNLVRPV